MTGLATLRTSKTQTLEQYPVKSFKVSLFINNFTRAQLIYSFVAFMAFCNLKVFLKVFALNSEIY